MFKNKTNIGKFIWGVWTVFTTAATLILGLVAYNSAVALDRLEAREKLDEFMVQTREKYRYWCIKESERLRPAFKIRYEALVEVADVDMTKPPYNKPCRNFEGMRPNAPKFFGVSFSSSKFAARYPDWTSFIDTPVKKATTWVGDIPIEFDISNFDFSSRKETYDQMISAIKTCENKAQSNVKYTFMSITCFYDVGENNNINMYSAEASNRKK